jgi:hypothetical protein
MAPSHCPAPSGYDTEVVPTLLRNPIQPDLLQAQDGLRSVIYRQLAEDVFQVPFLT